MNKIPKKNNSKLENAKKIAKIFLVLLIVCAISLAIYFFIKNSSFAKIFNDVQKLKEWILAWGFWSYLIFVILQFLQVTFLPLPASLTTLAGVIIFGPFYTFLLSTLSIILGSIFAFFLGKFFGIKLLNWIFGKEKTESFQRKLKKGNILFFFMMLFPFFPDDLLCMMAGTIDMNFKYFLVTNLITRPVGLFCLCFFGGGYIIPFHSWGLWVWGIMIFTLAMFLIYYFKNKQKIDNFFNKKLLQLNNSALKKQVIITTNNESKN